MFYLLFFLAASRRPHALDRAGRYRPYHPRGFGLYRTVEENEEPNSDWYKKLESKLSDIISDKLADFISHHLLKSDSSAPATNGFWEDLSREIWRRLLNQQRPKPRVPTPKRNYRSLHHLTSARAYPFSVQERNSLPTIWRKKTTE